MSSQERLTIMILEDNRADVHLLKEALLTAEMNFTALVFTDGESASRYIDGNIEPEAVPVADVAILDLNVPKRNGAEVLGLIRSHPRWRHIPVVVLSSSPRDVMRNRAAQADCYITKPSDLQAFLGIGVEIRDCVRTVRAARPAVVSTSGDEGKVESVPANAVEGDAGGSNGRIHSPPIIAHRTAAGGPAPSLPDQAVRRERCERQEHPTSRLCASAVDSRPQTTRNGRSDPHD